MTDFFQTRAKDFKPKKNKKKSSASLPREIKRGEIQ